MYRIMRRVVSTSFLFIFLFGLSSGLFAKEVPFTLEDRDRLIRMETTLREFKDAVDKRFEQVDKRFEQVDKRFEQVDKRFEQVDKRIDQLFTFLWIITGIFTAITVSTISFAIWDRRSMIRPFELKTQAIEQRIKELDEGKLEKLILSLRDLAKVDSKVAEALKKFSLL